MTLLVYSSIFLLVQKGPLSNRAGAKQDESMSDNLLPAAGRMSASEVRSDGRFSDHEPLLGRINVICWSFRWWEALLRKLEQRVLRNGRCGPLAQGVNDPYKSCKSCKSCVSRRYDTQTGHSRGITVTNSKQNTQDGIRYGPTKKGCRVFVCFKYRLSKPKYPVVGPENRSWP